MPRRRTLPESPAAEPVRATSYHHGDLRRAILDATLELLAEQKHWDFSLREVARRARVSHTAPYNHFADKGALLAAVAAAGFESLRAQMQQKVLESSSHEEALTAIGAAYVRFGVAHPAQYRLMFGLALAHEQKNPSPECEQAGLAAEATKEVLTGVIRRGAQDGGFAIAPHDQTALDIAVLTAWSLVHGLTTLAIDGLAGEVGLDPGGAQALAERIGLLFRDGLRRR